MFRNKKGVDAPGSDIAALILLIGLFILVYVILLPPGDRADILGETPTDGRIIGEDGILTEGVTLLSAIPGELHPFERNVLVRDLAPATLFTKTESETINLASRVEVKKNFFSTKNEVYSFSVDRLQDLQDAKLFFFIEEGDGTFYVEINGETVYERPLVDTDVPIEIPVRALGPNNNIELGVRGSFFENYVLRNVNIKIDKNFENTQVRRDFQLTTKERNGIEFATLFYFLNCLTIDEQGLMTVLLNDRILRSDFVVCDVGEQSIEFPVDKLRTGTNSIEFRIDQGNYQLDDLVLELGVGENSFQTYNYEVSDDIYFDIFSECYNACQDDCFFECRSNNLCFDACLDDCDSICPRSEAVLELRFNDPGRRKKGAITINEFQVNFNTVDDIFIRGISDTVRRGDNVLKIIPQSNFEITDMRVTVIE